MEDFSSLGSLQVEELDHRVVCSGCRRSQRVCLCPYFPRDPIKIRSHIIIIQHPKEALQFSIGSVNLVKNCLGPRCSVLVGLDFSRGRFPSLDLAFDSPRTLILFPGDGAISLNDLPIEEPRGDESGSAAAAPAECAGNNAGNHAAGYTVVVVDGTWAQAKKLLALNPHLHQLRKVYLDQKANSEYLDLRREPKEFFVSTLESVVQVLDILEPDGEVRALAHESLMGAFRAMVRIGGSFVPAPSPTTTKRGKGRLKLNGTGDQAEMLRGLFERFLATKGPQPEDPQHPKKHWIICKSSNQLDGNYSSQPVIQQSFYGTLYEMNYACKWVNNELGLNKGNKLSPLPAESIQ